MNEPETIRATVYFRGAGRVEQEAPPEKPQTTPGRVARVARLLALAIRFEGFLREGAVADCAQLARLGYVTRARVTQIMSLLNLASDIQEEILFLPRSKAGSDPVTERSLRPVLREPNWRRQRRMWGRIKRVASSQDA